MTVQSIERVFDILELLSCSPRGINLTEVGKRLDLHKSTVHRLLSVLKRRGYVEKDDATNLYRLGAGFVGLASMYLNSIELKTEAEPHLRNLSKLVNQTVYLATLQGGESVYLDKYEQFDSLRKYSIIGQRRPLYCTSLGKALLMDKTETEIRALLDGVVFDRLKRMPACIRFSMIWKNAADGAGRRTTRRSKRASSAWACRSMIIAA
jgi:IclR family KDG regulon transcriptional repressor